MMPSALASMIDDLLSGHRQAEIAAAYTALSDRYRRLSGGNFQISSETEALAYAAARMPATYGAAADVLSRYIKAAPDAAPSTILDVGAGPGTAGLAARALWPEAALRLVEPNSHLRDIAARLLPGALITAGTLADTPLSPSSLVLCAYVLNELPADARGHAVSRLWQASTDALILIEPGTPLGYAVILAARDALLAAGAHIAAPCPHHLACPLAATDRWCHFSVRVPRSQAHKTVKAGDRGFEDETFSYLVATRHPVPHPDARLIGHPRGTKLISAELCQSDGTAPIVTLSKRDPRHAALRRRDWGDTIDAPSG